MKFTKRILTAVLATVMVFSISACGSKSKDQLVMATNAEFPPYEYYENQKIIGIDAEIAQAIADKLGMELVIEDMLFDSIIPALLSGKADIGVAGMTITEDRLESVDFSDSYVKASQAIIVKKGSDVVKSAADLDGKTIGVQLGTTGDIYVADVTENVERFNKGFEAVQSLAQGKLDAVVIDDQVAKALAAENDEVEVLDEVFTEEEYAIAFKKGNDELVKKVNEALAELKADGTLQSIIDKYINAD
ncbi:MAG: basic amino acid ABC transporter substrate-binding protein [Lachnospiraceae bacterium]|nr:basic amino acid ABC transporter substrate-binding protein [Lachnospiraceae bacterium]